MSLIDILIFLITLVTLVVSHEFGHFISAKKFGVKVLEFGFGLPPRILGKKKGETIYSLNALPIGGFVRLYGEDEVDKQILESKNSFASQPVWERIGIVTAGVIMNLLLAVVIFYVILFFQGFIDKIPLLIPHQFFGATQTNQTAVLIGAVESNSPADQAGIKAGDRIIGINNQPVSGMEQVINTTKTNEGKNISLTLLDPSNTQRQVTATPRVNPPEGHGALGVELGEITMANLEYRTFSQKLFSGFFQTYNYGDYEIELMAQIVKTSIEEKDIQPVSQSVAGPVGITKLAGDILNTQSPILPYLNFVALISLSLAMFNILPIPALDGGRLFFLLIEAITRKKVRADIERYVHTVGMVLLLGLILAVTYSDIKKLIF